MRRATGLLLALAAAGAQAAPADYAREWPLRLPASSSGAYSVELTPEVYEAVQRRDLRDLDVLDASGRPVPATLVAPVAHATPSRTPLPWYRMPAPGATTAGDWRVIADLDAEGRLRGLRSSGAATPAAGTTLLMDAAVLSQAPVALEFDWRPGASFDVGYRLQGSADLDRWQDLGRGRLADATGSGRRLQLRRIALDAGTAVPRFLRLLPDDPAQPLPDLLRVEAIGPAPRAQATAWRTLPLHEADGALEARLPGRHPVQWLDLDIRGNDARTWRLQSREDERAPWTGHAAGWMVYRLDGRRSPPLALAGPVRDRHWRLVADARGEAPALRVGYVPERLVFVAAGRPPYVLVAGSLRQQREARPVQAALREAARVPAIATLGPPRDRAGEAALRPRRDWRTWGLWAALGLGVLAVGGIALRLLREPSRPAD